MRVLELAKAIKKTIRSKIFASHEFGYRRITIERPLRLSVQFTDERLETLRLKSGKLNAAMQKVYEQYKSEVDTFYGNPTRKRGKTDNDDEPR